MRRPSHPESGTTTPRAREYPVTTQATASAEPLSSTWMSGMATLTMLLSNTDMKLPTISTASGTIQPRSGGGAGAAVGWTSCGVGSATRGLCSRVTCLSSIAVTAHLHLLADRLVNDDTHLAGRQVRWPGGRAAHRHPGADPGRRPGDVRRARVRGHVAARDHRAAPGHEGRRLLPLPDQRGHPREPAEGLPRPARRADRRDRAAAARHGHPAGGPGSLRPDVGRPEDRPGAVHAGGPVGHPRARRRPAGAQALRPVPGAAGRAGRIRGGQAPRAGRPGGPAPRGVRPAVARSGRGRRGGRRGPHRAARRGPAGRRRRSRGGRAMSGPRRRRSAQPWVSVVVPARNEARNLEVVLPALAAVRPAVHEIIVVDGDSVDGTAETAHRVLPGAKVISQTRTGKGNALACGFAAATGDLIVMFDADGSADPAEIPAFVAALV